MGDQQVMNNQAVRILVISSIFSALAILAVVLRFLARTYKGSRYYLDDYLVVFALILTLGVTINSIVGVAVAGIGEDEVYRTSGPHVGFPLAEDLLHQGKVMFALQLLHICAMPLVKASVLAFYVRLFPTSQFRLAAYIVAAYTFCWWISFFFATIFQCHSISSNWATEPASLDDCVSNVNGMYEAGAFSNMIGDIIILALPLPTVFGLHMPRKHKLAVLGIFFTGALVVVAGIGRTTAYFRLRYNANPNFSHWYYPIVVWTSLEPCLGVISACLPTLRPLFSGLSPETLMGSVRSALSLHSLRGNKGKNESEVSDEHENLPSAAATNGSGTILSSQSQGGAWPLKMPDPNGSTKENRVVAMQRYERKAIEKQIPPKAIVVQEDLDQKVVHAADQV